MALVHPTMHHRLQKDCLLMPQEILLQLILKVPSLQLASAILDSFRTDRLPASAVVLLIWEILITLDQEFELIWRLVCNSYHNMPNDPY